MEALHWITEHWLDLLQSAGIVAGMLFTMETIRTDAKSRKISNLIAFAQHRHDIWKQMYAQPELARVLNNELDLAQAPITPSERLFVEQLILHLSSVHRASKEGMFVALEGLQQDMRMSFAKPVFRVVWEEMKEFQDDDFVEFVGAVLDSQKK